MGAYDAVSRHVEQLDNVVTARAERAELEYCLLIDQPNGRLVERYLANEIGVVLREREIGSAAGTASQYGFIWKAVPFRLRPGNPDCMQLDDSRVNADEPFVLSDNVEVVEGIKKRVPSFVRLQRFDFGDLDIGKPLFLFDVIQLTDQAALKFMDWEFSVSVRLYAVSSGECCGDHVESASIRVDNHSRLDVDERIERDLFARYKELIRGVRIRLEPERIRVTPHPGTEALLQNLDLGYGPLDAGMSV